MDALPALEKTTVMSFAATPSFDYPGGAWVVRLSRNGPRGPGLIEIARLRRQSDCNRYDIEKSWEAPLPEAELEALVDELAPVATPPAQLFISNDPMRSLEEVALDGTGIILRMRTFGWEVSRNLHHSGRAGSAVSSLFHTLVSNHVPPSDVPSTDWRTRRSR
jgi:hypothetical protein